MSESEIEYKVILIGNQGAGKTSFFKKLITGIFMDKNIPTIGIDMKTINQKLEVNKKGKIQEREFIIKLYDTGGQEKYSAITKSYYKGSDGILLIYDITNRSSFDNIQMWIDTIKSNFKDTKYSIILIGNKLDLIEEDKQNLRAVTEQEAKDLCNNNEIFWGGEISIKTIAFEKLKALFEEYIKKIYEKVGEGIINHYSVKLSSKRPRHPQIIC